MTGPSSGRTSSLRERLRAFGIRPKKQLGQNFLHDPNALAAIARAVGETRPERVLEIGPGPGTLTEHLAALGVPLVAVEKDRELVSLLRAHFASAENVEIREGDILELRVEALGDAPPAVAGNIPYNISTPILLHLLEQRRAIGPAVLMLQAELAQRLRAPVGTRASGSLTVLFALHAEVTRVLSLAPGAFFPPPKVDSEVVRIDWRSAPPVEVDDPAAFEAVVRAGFGQRRKTLRNALGARFGKERVAHAGSKAGVDLGRRAETLSLEEWAQLTRGLTP